MNLDFIRKSRILSYGIMTSQGSFYTEQSIVYGAKIVAGVQQKKGGQKHLGVNVYNTIQEAMQKTKIDVCVIHGSKSMAIFGMKEAIKSGIKVIVCLVGGIPTLDMLKIREMLPKTSILIGPSSLGIMFPEHSKIGVLPDKMVKKGPIGMISRHGSLTFEVLNQFNQENLGFSVCLSLGSELVKGMDLVEAVKMMHKDRQTKIITILANISGFDEERLAKFYNRIPAKLKKPIVIYMAGSFYDFLGKLEYKEQVRERLYYTTEEKKELLFSAGMAVVESPAIIAKTTKNILDNQIYISSSTSV